MICNVYISKTETYMTMLTAQAHRPPAAKDFPLTKSGSNSGSFRYGSTAFKQASGMFSLS